MDDNERLAEIRAELDLIVRTFGEPQKLRTPSTYEVVFLVRLLDAVTQERDTARDQINAMSHKYSELWKEHDEAKATLAVRDRDIEEYVRSLEHASQQQDETEMILDELLDWHEARFLDERDRATTDTLAGARFSVHEEAIRRIKARVSQTPAKPTITMTIVQASERALAMADECRKEGRRIYNRERAQRSVIECENKAIAIAFDRVAMNAKLD